MGSKNETKAAPVDAVVLPPCPCCNSSIIVARPYTDRAADEISEIEVGVVRCLNCGLTMETSCGQVEAEWRWSRRPSVDGAKAFIKALGIPGR